MATIIATASINSYINYQIGYDLLSQNTSGNYSTVRLYGILNIWNQGWASWSWGSASVYNSSASIGTSYGAGSYVLVSGDYNFTHNNDGSFSQTISGALSTSYLSGSCSGVLTLPTIKRYATVTGASNFTDEENPTVQFTNPANFPLTFKIEAGGDTSLIMREKVSNAKSPYTFSLSESERKKLRQKCPNLNTLPVRFTVGTVINNAVANWSYTDRTMTIVNSNPTINSWDYIDSNADLQELTGSNQTFIKGHSNITATVNTKATPKKESVIAKYRLTNGSSYRDVSETTETVTITLYKAESNTLTLSAYDSRGNVSSDTKTLSKFLEYESPKITNLEINRKENGVSTQVELSFNGTFWNSSFGKVNNTITVSYKYKETGSSQWIAGTTAIVPTIKENNFSATLSIAGDLGATGFDLDSNFDFQLIVVDKLETLTSQTLLSSGSPAIDVYKNNVSLGGMYDTLKGGRVQIEGIPSTLFIFAGTCTDEELQRAIDSSD